VRFFEAPNREETIHRSKAVGEPPLMLALSAFHALRDAIAAVPEYCVVPRLSAPATPERVLAAVNDAKAAFKGSESLKHDFPVSTRLTP